MLSWKFPHAKGLAPFKSAPPKVLDTGRKKPILLPNRSKNRLYHLAPYRVTPARRNPTWSKSPLSVSFWHCGLPNSHQNFPLKFPYRISNPSALLLQTSFKVLRTTCSGLLQFWLHFWYQFTYYLCFLLTQLKVKKKGFGVNQIWGTSLIVGKS